MTNNIKIPEFVGFNKISRLSKPIIITEKIDGTNAQIYITDNNEIYTGSRKKWITTKDDNHGFSKWVEEHKEEILKLGPGRHFGEWWGQGINRGYGLKEKRFSLFNVTRWNVNNLPSCISTVPVLGYTDKFDTNVIDKVLNGLKEMGSFAAPGFMEPEGIVIFHEASGHMYKKTIEGDEGKYKFNVYEGKASIGFA